jgi:hypothetical protein
MIEKWIGCERMISPMLSDVNNQQFKFIIVSDLLIVKRKSN